MQPMTVDRSRLVAVVLTVAAIVLWTVVPAAAYDITAVDDREDVYYVALDGRDTALPSCPGGSEAHPWRTITFALSCLTPGDRLYVRGGTYDERVLTVVNPGRRDARIEVMAYPGERPVIRGLLRLETADYWTLDGINVTGDGRPYGSGEYLVKMRGGVGWIYRDAEVWNARSYAAFRVESSRKGPLGDWRITRNCIHDTLPTHVPWQDHNVYIDTGRRAGRGMIDRNLIFNAPNGFNVKLGPGADPTSVAANVAVRFNTMHNGVQNVLASGASHSLRVERNILSGVIRPPGKSYYPHIRGFRLTGLGNHAISNLGTDPGRLVHNDHNSRPGWQVSGINRGGVDPQFDTTRSCSGFRPTRGAAFTYGRWAPPRPQARSVAAACPAGDVTRTRFFDVDGRTALGRVVDCSAWRGIVTRGEDWHFFPGRPLTRGQLASLIGRTLAAAGSPLPEAPGDAFVDDEATVHEAALNRLAAVGIFHGVAPGRAESWRRVTRAQLASLAARSYVHYTGGRPLEPGDNYFYDDRGIGAEDAINRVTEVGLTTGMADGRFGPRAPVTRGQAVTILVRLLDVFVRT